MGLDRRRSVGMAPNPISYQELEAFERKSLLTLTAWEAETLLRVDDAFLNMATKVAKPPSQATKSEPIPASDAQGVKALFRGLATQKRVQAEAKSKSNGGARG